MAEKFSIVVSTVLFSHKNKSLMLLPRAVSDAEVSRPLICLWKIKNRLHNLLAFSLEVSSPSFSVTLKG